MEDIKRTFDILRFVDQYNHDKALSIKNNGTWKSYSSADYKKITDQFSLGLMSLGYEKGDKIATVIENRPEWNFIDFGMSQVGCVHVSIYPTIAQREYEHILSHSDAKMLIVASQDLYEKIAPIAKKTGNIKEIYTIDPVEGARNWHEILDKSTEIENPATQLQQRMDAILPEDLLTLIYTSGTTGLSKGVMLSHNNVVSNIKIAKRFVPGLQKGDRALSFLPLCHILERVGNYLWQYIGLQIYYPESIETLGDNMREIKVNTFITVPRIFEKVYDKIINKGRTLKGIKKILFFWAVRLGDQYDPDPQKRNAWYNFRLSIARKLIFSKWQEALGGELKAVISGGAALQARLARVFWAAGIVVQEGYGLTETSPLISANRGEFPGVKFGSVGIIPEGIEVKIAADGEILARGENVMQGYYKDPDLTKQAIDPDGWFYTGDIGHLDSNNMLFITDRKKEIFKLSGGKYVAPQKVENDMKESQFIDQIMVVGENQKYAAAIIIPDFEFLKKWCELHDVEFISNEETIKNQVVIDRIQKELDKQNAHLDQVEKVKVFKLLNDNWNPDNGLLTPTQKLKRKNITERHQDLIASLFTTE